MNSEKMNLTLAMFTHAKHGKTLTHTHIVDAKHFTNVVDGYAQDPIRPVALLQGFKFLCLF